MVKREASVVKVPDCQVKGPLTVTEKLLESKVRVKPSAERDLISATVIFSAKDKFLVAEEENLMMSVASGVVPPQFVQFPASEKLSELVPVQTQVLPAAFEGRTCANKLRASRPTAEIIMALSEDEDDIFKRKILPSLAAFFSTEKTTRKNVVTQPLGFFVISVLITLLLLPENIITQFPVAPQGYARYGSIGITVRESNKSVLFIDLR